MEYKKKLDFDPKEADYAAQVQPHSSAAIVFPVCLFTIFIIVPGVGIGFLLIGILDGLGPVMLIPVVFLVGFIVTAICVLRIMLRGAARQKLPAILIKGNTVVAQYRAGWYYIHKSEIKCVSVSELPGEPPEAVVPAAAERADVSISNTFTSGATYFGSVSFVGNDASFAVNTPSSLGAVRAIAQLITRQ